MRENKDYLITEKPSRALLIFSIPMIIGNLFQQAYTIVDSAIVGRYVGETALAAVGASYALTSIFICIAIGGGIGASVIISHHFGGHNYGRMKTGIRTALLSFLFISLILGGIGLIFSQQIMEVIYGGSIEFRCGWCSICNVYCSGNFSSFIFDYFYCYASKVTGKS